MLPTSGEPALACRGGAGAARRRGCLPPAAACWAPSSPGRRPSALSWRGRTPLRSWPWRGPRTRAPPRPPGRSVGPRPVRADDVPDADDTRPW